MPRIPIYPEVEKFIILKKRTKLEEVESDNKKENSTTQTPKRTCKQKKEQSADQNLDVVLLTSSFVELSATMNGSLFVSENGLKNYGQSLSTAYETVATTYNNYYVEKFEQMICNYFKYTLKTEYPDVKIGCIKNLVYNHVYDQVLTHSQPSSVYVDILALFDPDVASNLTSFLNPLILEVKNRMSTLPLTKENLCQVEVLELEDYKNPLLGYPLRDIVMISRQNLNKEPFEILPALRYILNKYDDIYKAQAAQTDKADSTKPPLPRRFSLFPNPSLHWRFIKIDAQNLTGISPEAKQKKQANESSFDHQQRCFYQAFAFKKLGIQRVLFARRVLPSSPEDNIRLELDDFLSEEVNEHFRPCTVDPGRRDPFVSYHGGTDIRRLSSIEYYNMGGSVTRMKKQQKHKQELGIEKIETDIPSPKTASVEQFVLYVAYMLQHMNTLFDFYGFDTSKVRWLNYLSFQQVIEESVSILINGGKNSTRAPRERKPITTVTTSKRKNKACFEVGDKKV
ncbi:hypothetical protein MFLAVUS_009282 [Mucor flavus]|uniref:Uncharacterized protein n=1 Tax=Mucor flavus TaxID=439312 RepID=A0ABP9Z9F9_9FUNG